jgi:hypothetical protein
MTATLNEDTLTLIYSNAFDFTDLRTAATAIATEKQHPLRDVVLRRLLQLPLRLSSENLDDSKALIDHLSQNPRYAELVREITVILGPSRKYIAEHQLYGGRADPEDPKRAERAEELVGQLPKLLRRTVNLQRLDWSRSPLPSKEVLVELSEHSRVTHVSLDCSVESDFLQNPADPIELPDTTIK